MDKDDTLITVAVVAGVSLVNICTFAAGYDSGFQQAMKQPQKPTVIFGTQIINNSNSFFSPDAGSVSNSEQPRDEKPNP